METAYNILIVEDNMADADILQRYLQRSGIQFNATLASDREEFIQAITHQKFDIVLADHSLPQFTSVEALEELQKLHLDTAFILVTGTVSEEFAVNILRKGADDYILKGNLQRLPNAIKGAIEKRKMNQDKMIAEEELKESNNQLRELASHLQNIREEERASMAREIHDELGQQLTGLKLEVSWLSLKIPSTEKDIQQKIHVMADLLNHAIVTVRKIATELRPAVLDDQGLSEAIKWLNREHKKRTGLSIHFKSTVNDADIDSNNMIALFRIYQESLTNVMRHAEATVVSSVLENKGNNLLLTVTDNGKGFDTKGAGAKKTLGLISMKERAFMAGGKLEINSLEGSGTTISVSIPVKNSVSANKN